MSVCIIAKNESKHIETCLQKLKLLRAECIVVDTGSDDQTAILAEASGARIYHFPWNHDFSSARNYAASVASNDMILSVDCDEYLDYAHINSISNMLNDYNSDIGVVEIINHILREDKSEDLIHEPASRLYNRKLYHFQGAVHETLAPIDTRQNVRFYDCPLQFQHMGYLTPDIRRNKSKRDEALLLHMLSKSPADPYLLYQLGKCSISLGDSEEAISRFEKAIDQNPDIHLEYVQNMILSYGYALLDEKRYQDALALSAFDQDFADSADFLFLLGLIYMNNVMFPEAIGSFQQAMSCTRCSNEGTNSYKAWYNIGVIQELSGHPAEARESYARCENYKPALERITLLS